LTIALNVIIRTIKAVKRRIKPFSAGRQQTDAAAVTNFRPNFPSLQLKTSRVWSVTSRRTQMIPGPVRKLRTYASIATVPKIDKRILFL
jgi:hypothetical protein